MSSLEAAFQQKKEQLKAEQLSRQKARLVADPFIAVSDIEKVLTRFCQNKQTQDIHSLLCPPASLVNITWQTLPHGEWMTKTAELCFEILDFAPNTKLQGTKVKKALQSLVSKRLCSMSTGGKGEDDALDKCDLCLRMVLNMYREVKSKPTLKQKVMRTLSRDDGIKMQMVLDKVVLPPDALLLDDSQETEVPPSEPLALMDGSVEDSSPVVPLEPAKKEPKAPATPQLKRSFQFSEQHLPPLNSIFSRILHGTTEASKPMVPEEKKKKPAEEDILAKVLNAPPSELAKQPKQHLPKPSKPALKKPSMKKAKGKKAKNGKKGTVEIVKSKPKAKAKAKAKVIQVKAKAKAKSIAKPEISHQGPKDYVDYKVEVKPVESDTYRSLYTSRHYWLARNKAKKAGFPEDICKEKGKMASREASVLWDDVHPNWESQFWEPVDCLLREVNLL